MYKKTMTTTSKIKYNKNIIDVLSKKNLENKTPLWLMRQAGRYLPEYRNIRGAVPNFLDLCYDSELASQITLQPISRFGFDAAILFADILIVPHSLGLDVRFESNEGPIVEQITKDEDLKKLQTSDANWQFDKIWKTVSLVKNSMPKNIALIGFAGAAWTVATYIVEGRGGKKSGFNNILKDTKENPEFIDNLIEIINQQTIPYILGQIDAGAEIIQLFDSWANVLDYDGYKRFVETPTKKLVAEIRKARPGVPIICFPKDIKYLREFCENVRPDGVSLGPEISVDEAKKLQETTIIQGNLDPEILAGNDKNKIKESVTEIMQNFSGKNFIFNLGHGILPQTPIENVEYLVSLVRNYE